MSIISITKEAYPKTETHQPDEFQNTLIDQVITKMVEESRHIEALGQIAQDQQQKIHALETRNAQNTIHIRAQNNQIEQQNIRIQVLDARANEADKTTIYLTTSIVALAAIIIITIFLL